MGLARLWQSWGLEPDVVLGHSVGQYSAACVAGVFDLADGARLMAERGRLFASLPAGGRMVAVFTAPERVEALTDEFPTLSVAAYNGANTVLSGPADDLAQATSGLAAAGVRCDWLDTSHAFHSALLDPILDEFESFAAQFEVNQPQRILIDNRTGAALGRSVKLDGTYWRRHARQPVEFAKSVRTLAELNCKVLVEIGPRPVLTEVQALVAPSTLASPRRTVVGLDSGRVSTILAVLEARCGIPFTGLDVFLNVAGGMRVNEPAADLAIAGALLSAREDSALPPEAVLFGEISLSGALRPVAQAENRLKEAQKLGFSQAILPDGQKVEGVMTDRGGMGMRRIADLTGFVGEVFGAG